VTETMGPTVFIPKSNREEIHKQHASRLPITMDRFSGQMKAGDCVVMGERCERVSEAKRNRSEPATLLLLRRTEFLLKVEASVAIVDSLPLTSAWRSVSLDLFSLFSFLSTSTFASASSASF